jgi:hypothetical protein
MKYKNGRQIAFVSYNKNNKIIGIETNGYRDQK